MRTQKCRLIPSVAPAALTSLSHLSSPLLEVQGDDAAIFLRCVAIDLGLSEQYFDSLFEKSI
jgi:hypothetical protein